MSATLADVIQYMGTYATLELLTGNPTPPTPPLTHVYTEVPDSVSFGYPFCVIWSEGTGDFSWSQEGRGTIGGGPSKVGTDTRTHRVKVGVFVGSDNDKLQDLEKYSRQWPDLVANTFRKHSQLTALANQGVLKADPKNYEYATLELSDAIHFGIAVTVEVTVRYQTTIAQ